jgi:large subunit ribosomal protein L25
VWGLAKALFSAKIPQRSKKALQSTFYKLRSKIMLKLQIEKREKFGRKARGGKNTEKFPAVFYGPKEDSTSVFVTKRDFVKVWKEVGESSVIILEGAGDEKQALIQEVALDPVSDEPIHADFYIIEKGKKVEVDVPLEYVGESPAVKNLGAVLVKVMHELPIEAEPVNLPHEIEVDISSLVDFESNITVKDLKIPAGVTVLAEAEETVALVQEPREEEEEEEPVEFDESMVEVEKKGKEESEGDSEGSEGPEEKGEKPSKE